MGDKYRGADMYMEDKYMEADKSSTLLYGSRQTSVRPGGGVPHRASTLLRPAPCLINFYKAINKEVFNTHKHCGFRGKQTSKVF